VRAFGADDVVIATGAVPSRPWFVGDGATCGVADVRDVLTGDAAPSGRVVVFDELGFHHATSVAELLADRGCDVEIITPGMVVGQDLGVTLDMEQFLVRAHLAEITLTTDTLISGVEGDELQLTHHPTGADDTRTVDWLVLSVQQVPDSALYHESVAAGLAVHRVGDALAPRRAHAAVIDGQRVGSQLGRTAPGDTTLGHTAPGGPAGARTPADRTRTKLDASAPTNDSNATPDGAEPTAAGVTG